MMHEGTVVREIINIVGQAAHQNQIEKVYEIVLRVGPYSCLHEQQLNWYFDILSKGTCMEDAMIMIERDDTISGASQMYVKTFKGE